jgi:membrane-associated protein
MAHLEQLFAPLLHLTSTFDLRAAVLLFLLCAVSDLSISVPYVLESVWLLAGYYLGAGTLTPLGMFGLWLAAVAGRLAGSLALYGVLRFGARPLAWFYEKLRRLPFWPRGAFNRKISERIKSMSAFSGAYARLVGLSFPLAVALSAQRRPFTLVKSVLLASLVWDAVYILLGATVGTRALLSPVQMVVASVAGLTALYAVVIVARYLFRRPQPAGD